MSEPVVDGHQNGVFEELGQQEQKEKEEACRAQVRPTGSPRDGGSVPHHLRQVIIIIALHRLFYRYVKQTNEQINSYNNQQIEQMQTETV